LVKASSSNVKQALLEYIGVLGLAKSAYMEVNSENFKGYTIGSCLTKSLVDVRASLGLAGIKIERVSGTLRGLRKK